MNGGVSGKEKVIRTPFDFKEPYSDWRQIFKRPNQQYNPSNYDSSSEINEHDIETQKIEEGDGHDSGISSDDEDDRTTYTAVQLTNDSLDSQRYTGICIPTPTDGWVGENNHQTGLSGNLPNGSNNPQIFESTDSVQLDNIVFSNLIQLSLISQEHNSTCNDHVICDSGHNSDDEDQFKLLYEKEKIEAQNNQKYTENVCNPTNGGLLGESDNQQISEDTEITSDCNPDDSDPKGNEGYGLDGSCESKENLTKGADGSNQTFEGEQKSSEFPKVDNWSDSDGNSEDSSDSKKGSYYSSGNLDSMELTDDLDSENDRDLEDDNPFLKDSLFMKLKMSLTQSKQDLIDKCCGEVRGITEQNEQKDIKNTPESIKCIVAKYLEKEVMLNLKCSCCNKTVTNTVFEEIKDLTSGSHISNRSNTFVFDNFPYQSKDKNCNKKNEVSEEDIIKSIVSNLLLEGGKVKRHNSFDGNEFEQIVTCNGFDDGLSEKCKEIESKLKGLAYESIVNKSKQTQNVLGVDKDNRYFCIEYSQDSIVEVAEILNNEKAKDLNLRVGILKIGESIVRVENVEEIGGKRNYMDVSKGGIEMSFTTEVGEISIYLSPSEKGSNKIKVEIDGENRARFNELKNRGKSLGENCLLGGKSVEEAIEHESFERYGSVPNTAMKEPSLGCVANIARGG
ncbi:hypothetical protein HUB90_02545 [Wolbachia endosymbiont of Kradibia gibbosae]|uniref:hypothetical protein n=1 Tax=Wolbachia endosymbiont of Kradibia gibbosae TaxID=2742716 RepID=UPI0018DA3126|nr:hypothetical protein [Wolbachia endosymbiont of Kradibia gibbosae]MBH5361960.1 hypothetical protein [Wolbachia endosymbiont of Kradibia gibbosae]